MGLLVSENVDPSGGACLDPRGLNGRIYVGNRYRMQHTEYISCVRHGLREVDFLSFSHYKSIENLDPPDGVSLEPRAWLTGVM